MDGMNIQRRNSQSKEIEKYIKFFVIKSLQAVIMSRTGFRNKTKCNPLAKGQDWFNICLPEGESNRQLQLKIRELFGKKIPTLSNPVSLDIVLKTFEGSYIILETWQFLTDTSAKEFYHKNHFSIYNRLGVLIKSVLAISRILPSFNLSRKAEKDFQLYIKVHKSIYSLHQFELHKTISIGNVDTPVGRLNVKVIYRNKIWLSGSFHPHTYKISDLESLLPLSSDQEIGRATFQSIDMFENELALAASDSPSKQEWITTSSLNMSKPETFELSKLDEPDNAQQVNERNEHYTGAIVGHKDGKRLIAAFAEPLDLPDLSLASMDLPKLPPTPPFQSLFENKIYNNEVQSNEPSNIEKDITDGQKRQNDLTRQAEAVGFEDDFVLVELRPAFFSEDDSVGILYRQCLSPPPLEIFASLENEDKESEGIDLDTLLDHYGKEFQEYKNFFSSNIISQG